MIFRTPAPGGATAAPSSPGAPPSCVPPPQGACSRSTSTIRNLKQATVVKVCKCFQVLILDGFVKTKTNNLDESVKSLVFARKIMAYKNLFAVKDINMYCICIKVILIYHDIMYFIMLIMHVNGLWDHDRAGWRAVPPDSIRFSVISLRLTLHLWFKGKNISQRMYNMYKCCSYNNFLFFYQQR